MTKPTEVKEQPSDPRVERGEKVPIERIPPFSLADIFPDPQGMLDFQYKSLDEIKGDCFVILDANVMLLPYVMGTVTLGKVIAVYKMLAQQKRLVVPAQSAREFGKHRSKKIAETVKHLQDQASKITSTFPKEVGFLTDNADFLEVQKLSQEIGELGKKIQKKVKAIVEKISANVGRDPVSDSYREVLVGCVRDVEEPKDRAAFEKEMKYRYANEIPPGFKDKSKPDGGAGDLIIWQSILRAGSEGSQNSIFVTADTKSDWYTQSEGAFQPRLELLEEYRVKTGGGTIHIIPLSRLLELYEVDEGAIDDTRKAETAVANSTIQIWSEKKLLTGGRDFYNMVNELDILDRQIEIAQQRFAGLGEEDYNTSLSLPWNRARQHSRLELAALQARRNAMMHQIEAGDDTESTEG